MRLTVITKPGDEGKRSAVEVEVEGGGWIALVVCVGDKNGSGRVMTWHIPVAR